MYRALIVNEAELDQIIQIDKQIKIHIVFENTMWKSLKNV